MFPILAGSNPSGYNLTRSLRTRSSASANLSKTFGAAPTVRTKQTLSVWFKRGILSTEQVLMAGYDGVSAGGTRLVLLSGNTVEFHFAASTSLITTQVFRDPSAWYHLVLSIDTTQATASNRVKLYINGSQITAFGTANYPSQNALSQFTLNNGNNKIASQDNNANYFDGYLAEINFIDGQALTPSDFGSTNTLTGVWQPARYVGTYGTNGFYLPFTDNSALTTSSNVGLGKDFSGNGNYWATNNISITSGVTYDSMTDVPTLTSATAANFCVWNAVAQSTVVNGTVTRSNGNLTSTDGGTTYGLASFGTIASTTGKFYWEVTLTSAGSTYANIGVVDLNSPLGAGTHTGIVYAQLGTKNTGVNAFASGGGGPAYGASYTAGDVIGVALDLTAGTITFYKNNTSQGVAYTGISGNYTPGVGDGQNASSYTFDLNCGQRPFAYTPPTGFVALNTFNLPTSTIVKGNTVMDVNLWAGTGATLNVVNAAGFKPDLVWGKTRSNTYNHALFDSVRGVNKALASNSTAAEVTQTQGLLSFNSNGFTLGTSSDSTINNAGSGQTYVGWQWQAGQGTTSTNTSGSITSTVSVNASAGFSVVTYTGTNVSGATIGHGLGVAPRLIIIKNRSSVEAWPVYHSSVGATKYLVLNTTAAEATSSTPWNNTAPTSTVFSLGNWNALNENGSNHVAYCWTPIAGYSAFGSYTGNGSTDGPFVYLGFRPKWVMVKASGLDESWYIYDSARNTYNVVDLELNPNNSGAEATFTTLDFLSNGFKLRTTNSAFNSSGATYIYACFAENPFRNALAR